VTELPAAEIGVTRIALSPDGRRAAMLVRPDGLRLLELPATPLPVPGDIGRVSALGYAPDGTLLVGSDRVIALGPDGTRRELGRVETPLVELAVTADGTTAVGAVNGRALLWPMAGGARRQLELPSTVTPGPVEQADFLVFHDQDGLITVLRTADGALALHPVAGGGFPVVDLTGTMMVTGDLAGVIHVMDLTTQAFVPREPGALARWLVER